MREGRIVRHFHRGGVFNQGFLIKRKRCRPSLPVVPVKTIPVVVILWLALCGVSSLSIGSSAPASAATSPSLSPYLPDFSNRHVTAIKPTLATGFPPLCYLLPVTVNGIALPFATTAAFSRCPSPSGQRNTGRSRSTRLDQTHLSAGDDR